jgi:hypothetical protein
MLIFEMHRQKLPMAAVTLEQLGLFLTTLLVPKCSVADPDPGSGASLIPGSGIRDG